MNYNRIYAELMERAKSRVLENTYFEKHHIKPKAFGGLDDNTNIVKLLPREHFIAHLLLYKTQTEKRKQSQMLKAIIMMSGKKVYNSKVYEELSIRFSKEQSKRMSGTNHPRYGMKGKDNPTFGITWNHSDEAKEKLSVRKQGMVSALDLRSNKKIWVTKEDFDKYDYFVGQTYGSEGGIKDRVAVYKDKTCFINRKDLQKYLDDGYIMGKVPTPRIFCDICGLSMLPQNLKRHKNGKNCKYLNLLKENNG